MMRRLPPSVGIAPGVCLRRARRVPGKRKHLHCAFPDAATLVRLFHLDRFDILGRRAVKALDVHRKLGGRDVVRDHACPFLSSRFHERIAS
jgi:hypothetical protein